MTVWIIVGGWAVACTLILTVHGRARRGEYRGDDES